MFSRENNSALESKTETFKAVPDKNHPEFTVTLKIKNRHANDPHDIALLTVSDGSFSESIQVCDEGILDNITQAQNMTTLINTLREIHTTHATYLHLKDKDVKEFIDDIDKRRKKLSEKAVVEVSTALQDPGDIAILQGAFPRKYQLIAKHWLLYSKDLQEFIRRCALDKPINSDISDKPSQLISDEDEATLDRLQDSLITSTTPNIPVTLDAKSEQIYDLITLEHWLQDEPHRCTTNGYFVNPLLNRGDKKFHRSGLTQHLAAYEELRGVLTKYIPPAPAAAIPPPQIPPAANPNPPSSLGWKIFKYAGLAVLIATATCCSVFTLGVAAIGFTGVVGWLTTIATSVGGSIGATTATATAGAMVCVGGFSLGTAFAAGIYKLFSYCFGKADVDPTVDAANPVAVLPAGRRSSNSYNDHGLAQRGLLAAPGHQPPPPAHAAASDEYKYEPPAVAANDDYHPLPSSPRSPGK